ncbi:hypothetical protein N0V86_009870 [Didymella sp. IMI 355093]|nr:hypothetical protein N0V86_009870 [Didymella sp. IMI 355093]
MKFAITALFAGLAAAAPAAAPANPFETVTISKFVYNGMNGYPIMEFWVHSQHVDNVHCRAEHFEIGGVYSCDDPSYTFKPLEKQGSELTLVHVLNGPPMGGDFKIVLEPHLTIYEQKGTATADLDKETYF